MRRRPGEVEGGGQRAGAADEPCGFARGCPEGVCNPADPGRAFVVLGAEALVGFLELAASVAESDARTPKWTAEVVG
ncbi:hypothetical protein AB0D10_05655 [Kitasatospora sp. NPDC048545]|uniref:hypothetical protein n=1 Tax=Kitasatospora sp. NPDC048545 TaxID=3157208 RepID=UPI0033C1628B